MRDRMKSTPRPRRHVRCASLRYVMTEDESAQWDSGDHCDRREILYALGERVMNKSTDEGDQCVEFFHASGERVGKSVYHHS